MTMIHKLYEKFLDDPEVYHACELFWEDLVASLMSKSGQTGKWTRWISRTYANGSPVELDGNPICDGRSEELDRAFRIMQHPVGDYMEIAAWLKTYEAEYTELQRHELVLNLGLSEESAHVAEALLRKWMMPETTPDDMNTFIDQLLPP